MMAHCFRRLQTLQARFLLALVLVALLPLGLVGLGVARLDRGALAEQSARELTGLARVLAGQMEDYVTALLRDAQAIAALPEIVSMDVGRQDPLLKELFHHYLMFSRLVTFDRSGQFFASSHPDRIFTVTELESFQTAVGRGQQAWMVASGRLTGRWNVLIHTPIHDAERRVVGVLGAAVHLENLSDVIEQAPIGGGGQAFVLDATGRVLLHSDRAAVQERRDYSWLGVSSGSAPAGPGTVRYDRDAEARVAGYAPVSDLGWTVVVERPETEVLAPAERSWRLALVGLLTSAGLALLAAVLLSRTLTRPVRALAAAARALGAGNWAAPLPPLSSNGGELGTLVEAFAAMREAVAGREEALAAEARFLRTQTAVAQVALSSLQPNVLMPQLLEAIAGAQGYARGLFWRVGPGGHEAVVAAACGARALSFVGTRQDLSAPSSVLAETIRTGQPTFQNRVREGRFSANPIGLALGSQAVLGLPIVQRTGRIEGAIIFADDENPERFSERDVTQGAVLAHQVAQALENSALFSHVQSLEEQYQVMTDSLNDAVYTVDPEGRITFGNAALEWLTGYRVEEMLGRPALELYASDMAPVLLEHVDRLRQGELLVLVEMEVITQEGRRIPVELSLALLRQEEQIIGRVGVIRNITERKHLEEQLRQAQKMEAIGRLAGGVAHDFNNLLAVISGYSDLMLGRLVLGDPLHRHATAIKTATDRAATLTHQLLAFSRRQALQPIVLDLNAVVANLAPMLRRLIGEDIAVVHRLSPTLERVQADQGQIEQVIMNLAVNARDAMPQGGQFTITTANVQPHAIYARRPASAPPGAYVMLALSDTGYGMDAATRSHLFEPFFTTKELGKGTGLGLSTVYGIVTQSGGYIEVDSAPGHGATFTIYLPRVADQIAIVEPDAPRLEPVYGAETVLLVEDETEVRELVRDILHMGGYTVLEAADGGEALQICAQHESPIDLLLTDVVMPVLSGPEVAQRLAPLRPALKVLYMSGYTGDALAPHGALAPDTALLQKPFTADGLARKVREVLDGHGQG